MAVTTEGQHAVDDKWYAHTPDEVAAALEPRPRGESVLTSPLMITVGWSVWP